MINNLVKPKWDMYDISDSHPEVELFDSLVTEYNDIGGVKIEYYIRDESIEMDQLYGESVNTAYLGPYTTKMTYEVTKEDSVTDAFGITSVDMIEYGFIPKTTYQRDVSNTYDPKPGDVIKTLWNERSYEVVDVGEEESIHQLHKRVYEFIMKPYRFSDQSDSAREVSYDVDSTLTEPLTAYGDNQYVDGQSSAVDDYTDVDEEVYGF